MAFDPDKYLASLDEKQGGGFDPDAYVAMLDAKDEKKPSGPGAAQAGLEHFGNSAGAGYLPQMQAVSEPTVNRALDLATGNDVTGESKLSKALHLAKLLSPIGQYQEIVSRVFSPEYVKSRDENSKRLAKESEEHPYVSGTADVLGTIANAGATSSIAPIKAASWYGRAGQAALGAGIAGGIQNPGDKEGELAPLQLDDRAKNAAVASALGAAGQTALEGVTGLAKSVINAPNSMKGMAEERAFKSAGGMKRDYKKAMSQGEGRVNELGRYMLDNGLVKPGMTVEDVADAASKLRQDAGAKIGDSYKRAYSAAAESGTPLAALSPKDLAQEFSQEYAASQRGVAGGASRVKAVQGLLDDLAQNEGTGIEPVNKFREQLDKLLYAHNKTPGTIPESKEGMQDLRQWLDQRVDGAISAADRATGGKVSQELPGLNRDFGRAREIEGVAKDRAMSLKANSPVSLLDAISGVGGMVAGAGAPAENTQDRIKHAAEGLGLGVASKLARKYGPALVSQSLDKGANLLAKTGLQNLGDAATPYLKAAVTKPVAVAGAEGIDKVMSGPTFQAAALRNVASSGSPSSDPSPQSNKGPDSWARTGIAKLGLTEPALVGRLLSSTKGRELLHQASSLKPGSPALKRIQKQIGAMK